MGNMLLTFQSKRNTAEVAEITYSSLDEDATQAELVGDERLEISRGICLIYLVGNVKGNQKKFRDQESEQLLNENST